MGYESGTTKFVKTILILIILGLLIFLGYKFFIKSDIIGEFSSENPITLENLNEITVEDIEKEALQGAGYHYYYNQLDDNAKIFYKGLEKNIDNLKTGTYKIDFGTYFSDLIKSPGGEEKLNTAFQSAWNAFTYDHVEVFYLDITKLVLSIQTTSVASITTHRVFIDSGENESYKSAELKNIEIEDAENELEELRGKIVKTLEHYSDYYKILYLHDWLIDNIEYDTTYEKENIYNIYGTLKNGEAVCEGYARTFKYIIDSLGIPCVLVSGTATNSSGITESHAWNYVQLDGKWYAIDITWDDPIMHNGGTASYDTKHENFLKGSNTFFQAHKEKGELSDNSMKFVFPQIEMYDYQV